jgi:hypothetical protein
MEDVTSCEMGRRGEILRVDETVFRRMAQVRVPRQDDPCAAEMACRRAPDG